MRHVLTALIIGILLFAGSALHAQAIWGKATYESKVSLGERIGPREMSEAERARRKKEIEERLSNTYTLVFDASSSLFTANPKLQSETKGKGRFLMAMMNSSTPLAVYKNSKENRYVGQTDLLGKLFLVEDSLARPLWRLEEETKMVGDFFCQKATLVKTVPVFRRPLAPGRRSEEQQQQAETEEVVVTAWYTPDVPVGQGPAEYWGLPGLIIEVSDNRTVLACTSLSLQKEKLEIRAPKKGKKISREGYEILRARKMKQMRENWRQRRSEKRRF